MSLPLMERHIDVDEVVRPTTVEVARFTGTDHKKKKSVVVSTRGLRKWEGNFTPGH